MMKSMAANETAIAVCELQHQKLVRIMDGMGLLVYTGVQGVVYSSFIQYTFFDRNNSILVQCSQLGTSCCGYAVFHSNIFPACMEYWRSRALLLEPDNAALIVPYLRRRVGEDVAGMVLSFADAACCEWCDGH
jgi:hypothetical protein